MFGCLRLAVKIVVRLAVSLAVSKAARLAVRLAVVELRFKGRVGNVVEKHFLSYLPK